MKEEKILRKILEENNSKITRPRLMIFRILHKHGLQSIAEIIKQAEDGIDRVSIYRTIELFDTLGIVHRVNIGWKYKIELSEIFLDHHHHVTCLGCNKVVAIREDAASEQLIKELASSTDFSIISHQIEFQGYCPRCSNSSQSASVAGGRLVE